MEHQERLHARRGSRRLFNWIGWANLACLLGAGGPAAHAQTLTTVHNFAAWPNGQYDSICGLVQGTDGDFYGTSEHGGAFDNGTIFKITSSGTITILHNFSEFAADGTTNSDGAYPQAPLIQAKDGDFYGTAPMAGAHAGGTAFKITSGGTFTTLHSFNSSSTDGNGPYGGLIQATDGDFYGTTNVQNSSTGSTGAVYKLTSGGTETILHNFSSSEGFGTQWPLLQAKDGDLYGVLSFGGDDSSGVAYKISTGGTFTLIHTFGSSDDVQFPLGAFVQGSNGDLYGASFLGGDNSTGVIYGMTTGGSVTNLHSFSALDENGESPDGGYPHDGVILGKNGDLYGATNLGGEHAFGAAFQLTTGGTFTTLHSFDSSSSDGQEPYCALVQGTDGDFYGTTQYGGSETCGVVFKVTSGGTCTTLKSFGKANADGASPDSVLVKGADGNYYGTATNGGTDGTGTIFKVSTGGTLTVLYDFGLYNAFGVGTRGGSPRTGLAAGSDGNLYGTTVFGGAGSGTFFKITTGGTLTYLHSFAGDDSEGTSPNLVVEGKDGNFYGTCEEGGANSAGTVFKVSTSGDLTVLHDFNASDTADGANPHAGLIQGSDGDLYGTTFAGGANMVGAIYKITTGGTFKLLYSFGHDLAGASPQTTSDGGAPKSELVQASDGDFYGGSLAGGKYSRGTLYKITSAGAFTALYQCGATSTEIASPGAALIQAKDGNLYGTSVLGGAQGQGTIFKLTTGGTVSVLYSFASRNALGENATGGYVDSGLVQLSDGTFEGATLEAGTGDTGVVYNFNPTAAAAGTLAFGTSAYSFDENSGTITVHVLRSGGSNGAVGVTCATESGTAKSGTDYTGVSKTLSWASGDTSQQAFTVSLKDLGLTNGSTRDFSLKLSSPTGGATLGSPATATITIDENDTRLAWGASSYNVNEDAGSITVHVLRTGDSTGAVSVTAATSSGTAKSGTDYTGKSETLSWASGDTAQKAFTVSIKDLKITDGSSRHFGLLLSSPTANAVLGSPDVATINIVENDNLLAFGTSNYSVDEDAGSITVHVLRTGSTGALSVVCGTSSDTAKSGTDYTGKSETLKWAAGDTAQQAFTVAIADLGLTSGDTREFHLVLSSPSGAQLGSPSSATVTIKENDPNEGELEFAAASYSVDETAGSLTVHVKRTVGTSGAVSVTCATSSGTAKSGTDYDGKSATLSWASGDEAEQSFTVDLINRGSKGGKGLQFRLELTDPKGSAIVGKPGSVPVTIN